MSIVDSARENGKHASGQDGLGVDRALITIAADFDAANADIAAQLEGAPAP
jgi:hypothetical protein